MELSPLDDISTWITTERPPKEYFLPLPVQITVIAFLLCLSALFSGLTLGLMSLTPQELELVMKAGSPSEQKYAAVILPIRRKGNLLLCSLLLGNVIVNAAISILFGELTTGLLALLISSIGIVIFGEIVPQSICVKKGLAVGAHTILITQVFIFITYPVAWPISKLLDCLLGDEY
ncbi:CNNM transmembrane domain-containing protein, partial [Trichostrongylus colubriformis]